VTDSADRDVNGIPTTLDESAISMHEMFASYVRAGFTRHEALQIVIATFTAGLSRHMEDNRDSD
jgi:hypothetical protein